MAKRLVTMALMMVATLMVVLNADAQATTEEYDFLFDRSVVRGAAIEGLTVNDGSKNQQIYQFTVNNTEEIDFSSFGAYISKDNGIDTNITLNTTAKGLYLKGRILSLLNLKNDDKVKIEYTLADNSSITLADGKLIGKDSDNTFESGTEYTISTTEELVHLDIISANASNYITKVTINSTEYDFLALSANMPLVRGTALDFKVNNGSDRAIYPFTINGISQDYSRFGAYIGSADGGDSKAAIVHGKGLWLNGRILSILNLNNGDKVKVTYTLASNGSMALADSKLIGKTDDDKTLESEKEYTISNISESVNHLDIISTNGNYVTKIIITPAAETDEKIVISPTVTISGWNYGETPGTPEIEGNSGDGSVTYQYKVKDSSEDFSNYPNDASTIIPGTYTLKASIAETESYQNGEATTEFTVGRGAGSIHYGTANVEKTTEDGVFINQITKVGDGTVSYSSDNTNVATIDANTGEVTIKGTGNATITATVSDGTYYDYESKTATYQITVTEASSDKYILSVTSADDSKGTVAISPEPADGKYVHGTEVTITANAEEGYEFDYWTVNNNKDTEHTTTTLTVTMTADMTIVATFKETEKSVSGEKTWTFNSLTEGTQYSSYTEIGNAYLRTTQSGRSFTVTKYSGEQNFKFSDGIVPTVNNYLYVNSNATYNKTEALTETSTAGDGKEQGRGMFAFNTKEAGTFYALISGPNTSSEEKKIRVYFADGTNINSTDVTCNQSVQELSLSATTAGSFFVGGITTTTSNIYAVRFVPDSYEYPIIISDIENGTITSDKENANSGSKVTLNVVPNEGYVLGQLTAMDASGNTLVISDDYSFTMPAKSVVRVEATFKKTYAITTSGLTGGTITASPNSAAEGTEVTLTIAPDNGNQLKEGTLKAYKTGDESTPVTIGEDNKFMMPAYDVTIIAEFEVIPANTHSVNLPEPATLTGGSVSAMSSVAVGETVTLTIAPSEGYEVDQVMIDGTTLEPDNGTYKFTMPDKDVTVSVTFKKVDLSVTAASGIENGSLSFASNNTNGANKFQIGDVVTITATPSSNDYQLKANSLTATYNDGAEKALDINENNQFTMPGYNVTVTAAFEQKPIEEVIGTPTISIDTDGVVTITAGTSSVEGATIKTYYTVDGTTEPTTESTEYLEPFEVVSGTTVKAISINAATNKFSEVESKEYTYNTSVLNKISKTTTWTFEQFAKNQQLSNTNVYGYKGLYIKGHNETNYATVLNGSASTIIEGTEISVSKYLNLPGGSATRGTVANELPADRVAFCTSVPGTVYAYVMGRYVANKSLFIEVAGEQDKTQIPEKIDNNNVAIMLSHDITTIPEGGANVFIGSESGALDIYAIKFVAKDTYTLTTTSEHGTITVKREGEEEATEDRTFVAGTKLVLTAEASQGYNFSKWTVDGADAGTETTLNLTMDAAKSVVAVYQEKDAVMSAVTITQPTEGGIVKVMKGETEVTSGETVADGTTLTVVVTPERFYQVEKITVTDADNNEITLETDNSFKMPEKAVTVTATLIKEEVVTEATTWVFNDYTISGTETKGLSVTNKLYNRSASSGRGFAFTETTATTLTFTDGTEVSVSKIAKSKAFNNTNMNAKTAGMADNETTPFFAFNAGVPGTCYALVKSDGNKQIRVFFGKADGTTSVTSKNTTSAEITEIKFPVSETGVFFIGGAGTLDDNTAAREIYAIRFVPTKSYTVKATAGTGGTVSIKDGNGNAITSGSAIAEGTKVVLTATPDAANDYGFKNWTKADGPEVSTDAEYTIASLSEDIDVTANFEQVITYTVTTPEVTGGTVEITAGGETIASGSKIPAGTEVTVTATPASGYYFVNWGSEDLTDNPYTFTPTASTTLTAKFEAYPGTITYDFMGAYDADKKEIVCTGDETAMLHYIRTDDKSVSTNALFVSTQVLDLNGRISTSENSLTYAEKGITIKSGRAIAIHNLKENDVIRIEFDGELYYAWNNSKSERESNVLADMSTGDMIKTMTPYTVSSINATNNYVVFYTGAATTISQISINEELVLKSVPKPTVSSTYTVNEDSYTYTIEYMEGATLYYTLPGGEEQSKSGGESLKVNVTKLGDLTAYAKYGDLTSETASQRVYAPTPKIESNGVYDFSQVSSVMLKDYTLGTIGYGDAVTIGEIVLYKPDAVVAKTLDRFAFAPKVNEKGSNAGDWMLLGAGRLRAKNTVADTLAVLNLKQGEYVTFTYSGAELKYMSQSTATLAEDTDVLTSGQGYEVKSDGILLLTIPVTDGKNCDITKIAIVNEETVTAPTLTLKSVDTPNVIRLRNGSSSFGNNVVAYYTTDGTEPSATNGTKVEKFPYDITLDETCTVKAIAISETGVTSVTTTVSYIQSEDAEIKNEVKELVSVVDENNATVTSLIIGEDITTVTISAEADGVPVTAIADNLFTKENTATVGAIDLSGTAIAVSGDRSAIPELKNINPATLVYVPSTAVTGTNVVAKTGTGDNATYGCTDYQVYDQKLEEDGLACAVPHDFHADQATLVREFTSNVKCTVCLPYPFKATGGTFYYFKGISGNTVQMQAVEAGATLEANTPYIFEPSSNMGNLSATNVDVAISNAPQTENAEANFTFVGTYKTIVWDNPRGIYGFAAEGTSRGQFVRVGSGASIVACRAYLEYTEGKLNGAATRSANSLPDKLDVEWIPAASNGGTTGIMGTDQQAAADEPVYNLNGQRVDDSYKGLIIKNGKKMVKK